MGSDTIGDMPPRTDWKPRTIAAQTAAHHVALADETERLRGVLTIIAGGDYPRPVMIAWRADGLPSKHDQCSHSKFMYEGCGYCAEDFAFQALAKHSEGQS
jgi:hypothetical protein